GRTVIGAALAGRAADELAAAAHIPAFTVASLLRQLRDGEQLERRSVVIVDEAAMVGTRQLAELANRVWDSGSMLVLVRDDHQLPAIEAGGGLGGLARRLPV